MQINYKNENDKAYGLAGMVISVANLNAIDRIASVSLDAEGPMVEFAHEYYFHGSPSISPKTTWGHLISNLHLTTAMVVANILSRSLVGMKQEVPEDLFCYVYEEVEKEGVETCSLEPEEVKNLYDNAFTRTSKLFHNRKLRAAIDEFVQVLSEKRSLSTRELIEELHLLQIL